MDIEGPVSLGQFHELSPVSLADGPHLPPPVAFVMSESHPTAILPVVPPVCAVFPYHISGGRAPVTNAEGMLKLIASVSYTPDRSVRTEGFHELAVYDVVETAKTGELVDDAIQVEMDAVVASEGLVS